jgi:diaminopimelate epimerase
MRFAKAHAYGNDFLYVHQSLVHAVAIQTLACEMCDRHTGVGADGLIVYAREGTHVSMRLFNADGSPAEVSGNGVRALGALVLLHERTVHAEITVDTVVGPKPLVRLERDGGRQVFRSAMGLPSDLRQVSLEAAGERLDTVVLNFGNPQCIVLGPLPDQARFLKLGAALERHPFFPHRTNVEFAQVEAPDRIRILIWERGCGPTQSSGTGSCATLIAAAAFGGASRNAEVIAPGGPQRVEWEANSVYLTGWAEVVCEGEWLRQLPNLPAAASTMP